MCCKVLVTRCNTSAGADRELIRGHISVRQRRGEQGTVGTLKNVDQNLCQASFDKNNKIRDKTQDNDPRHVNQYQPGINYLDICR